MLHTRAALVAGLSAAAIGVGAFAPAQGATDSDDTEVTFQITSGGGLAVTAPTAGALGNITSGTASTSGTLGEVEVTDSRGALVAEWTVTVKAGDFVNQSDNTEKIGASNLLYSAVPAPELGVGVPLLVPGVFGAADGLLPKVTFAGVGNNRSSWTPNLTLTVPATSPVGVYKSTITHSVV